jgi:hypothetical protein
MFIMVNNLKSPFFAFLTQRGGSQSSGPCIKIASENPVLWTGMKDVSVEGRKKQIRC